MITSPRLRSAAVAASAAALLTACGTSHQVQMMDGPPPGAPTTRPAVTPDPAHAADPATWTKIAPWPYAPWWYHLAVWTGTEVLVFGGPPKKGGHAVDVPGSAPAAGAYNPGTNKWRPIAKAPFDLDYATGVGWSGGAYVTKADYTSSDLTPQVWTYSVSSDSWRRLPDPEGSYPGQLTLAGSTLALTEDGDGGGPRPIHLFDPDAGEWRTAPTDPWPDSDGHGVAGMPDGRLVLVEAVGGKKPAPPADIPQSGSGVFATVEEAKPRSASNPGSCWQGAVLDPGATQWRVLPSSGIGLDLIARWVVADGRLVNLEGKRLPADSVVPGCGTGDDVPLGGVLDVDAGQWEPFDDVPPGYELDMSLLPDGEGPLAVIGSRFYDPVNRSWGTVPPVPGSKHEFAGPLTIWAGDRLLTFANGIFRSSASGPRVEPVHVGWSWTPG